MYSGLVFNRLIGRHSDLKFVGVQDSDLQKKFHGDLESLQISATHFHKTILVKPN